MIGEHIDAMVAVGIDPRDSSCFRRHRRRERAATGRSAPRPRGDRDFLWPDGPRHRPEPQLNRTVLAGPKMPVAGALLREASFIHPGCCADHHRRDARIDHIVVSRLRGREGRPDIGSDRRVGQAGETR